MWLTVSCQKGNFFTVIRQKKQINIKISRSFQVFQISPFQLIFTEFWLLKNLLTGKTSFHVLKTLSLRALDITRRYLLISENISKFHK